MLPDGMTVLKTKVRKPLQVEQGCESINQDVTSLAGMAAGTPLFLRGVGFLFVVAAYPSMAAEANDLFRQPKVEQLPW